MSGLKIIGFGKALPSRVVTNEDLSRIVETSDEWITTRTGIKERRFCQGEESQYTLALQAAKEAIEEAGVSPEDISLCIVATMTPSRQMPNTACMLQKDLGLPEKMAAFDINSACTGFIYALKIASSFFSAEPAEKKSYALVLGVEQLSRIVDMEDRGTCILFGDGAGAAVVEKDNSRPFYAAFGVNGAVEPLNCGGLNSGEAYVKMDGQAVFRFAVESIEKMVHELESMTGISAEDIDEIVCHQANKRILDSTARHLKLPKDKFFMNLDRYGNTSAASIPMALYDMHKEGRLAEGRKIFCVGFGGGLTYGGVCLMM